MVDRSEFHSRVWRLLSAANAKHAADMEYEAALNDVYKAIDVVLPIESGVRDDFSR